MANEVLDLFKKGGTLTTDAYDLIVGAQLGSGMSRLVHVYRPNPKFVIKFENSAHRFQNVLEWHCWLEAKEHKRVAEWLAPCIEISSCGTILIQERTEPIMDRKAYPNVMPKWITDHKYQNFGRLNGKIVCHDYGTHNALKWAFLQGRHHRKADWYEGG